MRAILTILVLLAGALPPAQAAASELKFSTWNLEWLTERPKGDPGLPPDVGPRRPEDVAMLRRYAELLDADIVSIQEVDGPTMAARVFPPDRYRIHMTADRVAQRAGFAIRRGLDFTANPDLTALDPFPHAEHRLRSGADVTLHLPAGNLRLLSVHLKTGCREDKLTSQARPACATLQAQLRPLQDWIAARQAEHTPFMLLGDFNRWMDGKDAFFAGLAATAPLARPTEGQYSRCWGGGGFIDHIIAGGAARTWLRPDSLRVLVYRETGAEWKERLSDHCPVSVKVEIGK